MEEDIDGIVGGEDEVAKEKGETLVNLYDVRKKISFQ